MPSKMTVTFGDLLLLTRFALRFEQSARAHECASLLARAEQALDFVEITGHAHPLYGDGSIGALAARLGMAKLASELNADAFHAISCVLSQLSITLKKS